MAGITLIVLLSSSVSALAQRSAIESIQRSFISLVHVKAENAALEKSANIAVRHPQTGKILIMKNLKGAQYARTGTGIIIGSTGIIATNAHIADKAARLSVTLQDATTVPAVLVWAVPGEDLAFIKIAASAPLAALEFADSDALRLRDEVYAVGGSDVLNNTIMGGTITGIGQRTRSRDEKTDYVDLIRTDIDIYKGDSGAPLLNQEGKFLGLFVAGQMSGAHSSFVIPSNRIKLYYLKYLEASSAHHE